MADRCPICELAAEEMLRFVPECDHQMCFPCAREYVRVRLADGAVPAGCFAPSCESLLPTSRVHFLLCDAVRAASEADSVHSAAACDDHNFRRYQRLCRQREDPSLRICPQCGELCGAANNDEAIIDVLDGLGGGIDVDDNIVRCLLCGHSFCQLHDDAHRGEPCGVFELRRAQMHRKDEASTLRAMQTLVKPCPTCSAPIERAAGCDHIVCTSCKKDFCFKCGTDAYLTGGMFRKCSQCDSDYYDHRYQNKVRVVSILLSPILIALALLYIILVSMLGTLMCCFFCCFFCGRGLPPNFGPEEGRSPTCKDGLRAVLLVLFFPFFLVLPMAGWMCCICLVPKHVRKEIGWD